MASLDRAELKKEFQKYDKNKDGAIDWQEVCGFLMLFYLFVVIF